MASYKDDVNYNVEMHTVSSSGDLVTIYPRTRKENIIDLTNASTSTAGLMSTSDKSKLDGIAAGAQVNTVTGVKGNAESSYRTGNINITAANVGLGNVTNESKATMFTNAALTGTPTAPTPASSTNSTQIATTAFVQSLVGSKIAAADAMIYKGTIGSSGATVTALPATHTTGWTYKVITAGTYAGVVCEVGDMIICLADGTVANNADWTVVQTNIDGAVTGPSSAVADRIAVFNGTTGKVIKDSGYTIATSVPANAKFTDTTYSAATTSAAGLMSASDKTKLNNIASGAQVNQNAFSNVKVGDTTVAADSVTDTLTLIAGSNVTLTPDASGDSVTIAATDTKYTHPSYTAKSAGLYKVTVDATGHVSATTAVTKADITALGIPGSDTNTDTKVTQTVTTSDATYPLLLAPSGQTATTTGTSYFDSGVTLNPSTNTIAANVSGSAASATKDSAGQQINTTYIKGISVSGKTITYTKGDGSTGTITTQDTTYSDMTGATSSAAGTHGLVPAPAAGKQGSFLRGDGTWATPYTHPSYTAKSSGIYKITVDSTGHISGTTAVTKDDIVNLGIPSVDTTYTLPQATSSTLGGVKIGSNITVSSGTISLSKSNVTSALGYTPPTSDTHYTTGLKVGASGTATGNASASNGSVYLNVLDNTTVRDSHLIKGTGATTVTSDATGVITINSTNTVYTHPSITASGTTSTPAAIANGGTFTAIDSVTVNSNGHVTGYNTKTVTLPTITAASLGLGNAMHFRGTTTDSITDGATTPTSVKLNGATTASSVSSGDVVLYGGLEFIWTGSKWQKLGDETSFALKSNAISSLSVSGKTITYTKADGSTGTITTQDTVYTHPSYTAKAAGLYKVTVDASGHVSAATAVTKSDITALGIPASNTDTNVTQTLTTSNAAYPLLLAPSGQTATATGVSYFDSGVTLNPSTNTIAANISGNATTATKLATARNFRIRTGAHSVTTTFNGSSDIQMDIDVLYEAYLAWGGKNIKGSFGALDAALIPRLGANRFAFMSADAITIEYSTDGGTTWVDYGASDATKISLVSGLSASIRIGKDETKSTTDKSNYMARVTIDAVVGNIYTVLEKFAIMASTDGSTGSYCTIEGQTRQNYADGVDTWTTLVDKQGISGWSGWNIINKQIMISANSGTESSRYGAVRFTFGVTSHESSVAYAGLRVIDIMAFGGVGWVNPSTMAATGNIYSYDSNKNVTFPATVTASAFSGPSATTTAKGLMGTTQVTQLNAVYTSTTTMAGVATMLNKLVSTATAISDTTTYISMGSSNEFRTRTHSMLWTYVKGKADSVYQPKGSYLTGITKSDVTTALGYTPPTSNTDTLMTQTANTGSTALPILIGTTASPSGAAAGAYVSGVTITPSTKTITATTFSGNATTATKATQDSAGQQINTTYIKALSISGKTITYTKGNGTTGTITTQDTTYSAATTSAAGLMSSSDKTKLNGIATGAQVNQNAFSNVVVGDTTVAADSATDTLTLVAGSNVTLTPDATNDKITIAATDTVYTHPSYTAKSSGLYKVTVDATGHVSATTAVTKSDITALGIPSSDTNTKVTQTVTTTNAAYPLLLAPSGQTATATTTSYFDSGVTLNPSTNTIAANVSGSAATATKATQDSAGQQISTTYIKGLSVSGKTITYTKGDGTTGTITTQDTTYTLPNATSSVLGGVKVGSNITVSSGTISLTKSNVTSALGYTPPQKLTFTDLTVATSDWDEDETYPDFPYKAAITCTGVTADYLAQVIFNVDEVISGIYAPVNETGAGTVSIWASELPEADIVIPTISCLL